MEHFIYGPATGALHRATTHSLDSFTGAHLFMVMTRLVFLRTLHRLLWFWLWLTQVHSDRKNFVCTISGSITSQQRGPDKITPSFHLLNSRIPLLPGLRDDRLRFHFAWLSQQPLKDMCLDELLLSSKLSLS